MHLSHLADCEWCPCLPVPLCMSGEREAFRRQRSTRHRTYLDTDTYASSVRIEPRTFLACANGNCMVYMLKCEPRCSEWKRGAGLASSALSPSLLREVYHSTPSRTPIIAYTYALGVDSPRIRESESQELVISLRRWYIKIHIQHWRLGTILHPITAIQDATRTRNAPHAHFHKLFLAQRAK